jgi:hypothetical protein
VCRDVIAVLEEHADYFLRGPGTTPDVMGSVRRIPSSSRAFTLAPCSRSMFASSVCPLREAKCNGVYLSFSRNLHVGATLKKRASNLNIILFVMLMQWSPPRVVLGRICAQSLCVSKVCLAFSTLRKGLKEMYS